MLAVLYAVGIGVADACACHHVVLPTGFALLSGVMLAVSAALEGAARRQRSRSPYGPYAPISSCLLMATVLSLGVWRGQQAAQTVDVAWPDGRQTYIATVVSAPHASPRTQRYVMDVAGHRIYAYVAPAAADTAALPIGQAVLLRHVRIAPPPSLADSIPFDYPRYLRTQGIAGTAYVPAGALTPLTADTLGCPLPRPLAATALRRHLARVRSTITRHTADAFPDEVRGIVEALTMGDKTHLSDDLRHTYAAAGASHLLALSGFHVGIIVLLLTLPGTIVRRRRRGIRQLPGTLLMLVVLWLFVALAGGTPSIVRAVTMYTLYAVALQLGSDRAPLHALMLAAWLMLLVRPLHLFDVGFQLSFAAMLAITSDGTMKRFTMKRFTMNDAPMKRFTMNDAPMKRFTVRAGQRLLAAVWGLVVVSVVAQMGTAPLVLHYFGQFPTWFALTNIVAVPLMYVVMALLALWWLLTAATPLLGHPLLAHRFIERALTAVVTFMNRVLTGIAHLPCSTLPVRRFGWADVALSWLALIFLFRFLNKKPRSAVYLLACVAVWVGWRLIGCQ